MNKTVSVPFQVFSGEISSETERFRVSRNQIFSSTPTMGGKGLGSSDNLCIPKPGHYLAPPRIKSCISPWFNAHKIQYKSNPSRLRTYMNKLKYIFTLSYGTSKDFLKVFEALLKFSKTLENVTVHFLQPTQARSGHSKLLTFSRFLKLKVN